VHLHRGVRSGVRSGRAGRQTRVLGARIRSRRRARFARRPCRRDANDPCSSRRQVPRRRSPGRSRRVARRSRGRDSSLCSAPLARFDGTASHPQISISAPSPRPWRRREASSSTVQICVAPIGAPPFDPQSGPAGGTGGPGTTVCRASPPAAAPSHTTTQRDRRPSRSTARRGPRAPSGTSLFAGTR